MRALIISKSIALEIASYEPVSCSATRKRLEHKRLRRGINEMRDYFGTYLVKHGLIKEEVDMLQGRITPSILPRHYWRLRFKELRDRTLEVTSQLEQSPSLLTILYFFLPALECIWLGFAKLEVYSELDR